MCGKFTQMFPWHELHALAAALGASADAPIVATPMRFAAVLRLDAAGARVLTPMRWGFADKGAKNPARPKHMHARGETVDTLPTFADAFAHRRGVIEVATFNEGEELPNGKTKQWTITPNDGQAIAIAVIYEEWVNGPERLFTFVQVTTPASPLIAPITDRMPAILMPDEIGVWLGEGGASAADAKALLRTFDDAGRWTMAPQAPARPRQPPGQAELF